MKAIVCNNFGPIQNIEYKDVKKPIIQDKSVIINVKSVGVNFPDGLLVQGKYQLKPETPFIPGCLLYTSPSPRDKRQSRMPSSA